MAADFSGVLFYLRTRLGTQKKDVQPFKEDINRTFWGWLILPVWNVVVNVG